MRISRKKFRAFFEIFASRLSSGKVQGAHVHFSGHNSIDSHALANRSGRIHNQGHSRQNNWAEQVMTTRAFHLRLNWSDQQDRIHRKGP